jgi:hypothetical protein
MDDYFMDWLVEQNIKCPNCGGYWDDYQWADDQKTNIGMRIKLIFECEENSCPEWEMNLYVIFELKLTSHG